MIKRVYFISTHCATTGLRWNGVMATRSWFPDVRPVVHELLDTAQAGGSRHPVVTGVRRIR